MQIERVAAYLSAVTGKAGTTDPQTSGTEGSSDNESSDTSTSPDTSSQNPVTGGSRTVTLGLFQLDIEAQVSFDFADIVAEKTRLLSTTLADLFKGLGVRMDEGITLSMDCTGAVTANGPGKDKIERLFEDNRELAKQLKEVMVLQSMLAMKMALNKWLEARKEAKTEDDRDAVDQSFIRDLGTIKALQFTMVLSPDGQLTSAALAYMNGAR